MGTKLKGNRSAEEEITEQSLRNLQLRPHCATVADLGDDAPGANKPASSILEIACEDHSRNGAAHFQTLMGRLFLAEGTRRSALAPFGGEQLGRGGGLPIGARLAGEHSALAGEGSDSRLDLRIRQGYDHVALPHAVSLRHPHSTNDSVCRCLQLDRRRRTQHCVGADHSARPGQGDEEKNGGSNGDQRLPHALRHQKLLLVQDEKSADAKEEANALSKDEIQRHDQQHDRGVREVV